MECRDHVYMAPTAASLLENPVDRGAWRATKHGATESQTQLSVPRGDRDLGLAYQTHPGNQASSQGEAKNSAVLLGRDGISWSPLCAIKGQSFPTLCDPMNRSMPGLPVHHQLPEFTQTQVR